MCIMIEGPELTLANFDNIVNVFKEKNLTADILKLTIT